MRKFLFSAVYAVLSWLNPYKGADRYNPSRSHIPGQAQDARLDITAATRLELLHKSRDFERNSPVLNRLADLFEQYVVGPQGLPILPDTSDDAWNEAASGWWEEWQKVCDLTSLLSFGTIQSIAARAWFIDGEIFILKTHGETAPFRPRIQLIEGHRVATPPHLNEFEGKTIIDGIEVNRVGRPTGYWVKDGDDLVSTAAYRRIPADQMIHIFEPSRPGQMRGLPFCYPVINRLIDLDDLHTLEMKAAKDAAEISNVWTNKSGEVDIEKLRRDKVRGVTRTDADGNPESVEERVSHIRQTLGGRTVAIRDGEKLEQFRSERPSVTTVEFWNYVTSEICAGTGISQLLVFPRSMQGTVARAELDIANSFFKARTSVFADAMERLYEWVMEWAIRQDRRLDGAPAEWFKCDIRAPRAVNVDTGRNSAAMIAELEAGATNYRAIYAPLGLNEKTEIRQRAREEAYIDKVAAEFGVTPDRIRRAIGESLKLQMAAENQAKQIEDDQPILQTAE